MVVVFKYRMFVFEVLLLQWAKMADVQWQCVELFSGHGNLSKAFREWGRAVASFDQVLGGDAMDFERPSGFLPNPQLSLSTCTHISIYFNYVLILYIVCMYIIFIVYRYLVKPNRLNLI